ncbi:hypothetical protein, partial [Paraburkholderia sp. UCT31]|uniref:hypothetical protein n=1 Tax=Paraburkholderia sp. UCT31 TaxID=2615209 RepID=UPI001CA3EBAB
PLRLPGLAFGSVTVMSIKSKMMGTILMSVLAVVYDGRREVLTLVVKLRAPCRSAEGKRKPWNNFDPQAIVKLDRRVKGARSRKVL